MREPARRGTPIVNCYRARTRTVTGDARLAASAVPRTRLTCSPRVASTTRVPAAPPIAAPFAAPLPPPRIPPTMAPPMAPTPIFGMSDYFDSGDGTMTAQVPRWTYFDVSCQDR